MVARSMLLSRSLAVLAAAAVGLFCVASGCGSKEEGIGDAECSKLKRSAFDRINNTDKQGGQGCSTDADCHSTTWPECGKPISTKSKDFIGDLEKKFDDGKCPDTTPKCEDTPMWCKQGLCAL
jgi:hypothetical protein